MVLGWNISVQCSSLTRCIPDSVKTARPLFSYSGRHLCGGGTQNLEFTSPPSHKSPNHSLKLIEATGWGQALAGDIFAGCGSRPNPYMPPISINLLGCNRAVESIPAGVGGRVHHRQVTTRLSEGGPVSHFLRQIAQRGYWENCLTCNKQLSLSFLSIQWQPKGWRNKTATQSEENSLNEKKCII